MAKREKEKKSDASAMVTPSLVDNERAVEVYLVDYSESDVVPEVMMVLRINKEQHFITLRDAVKEAQSQMNLHVSEGQPASLPQLLPLSRQLVQVGDAAVLDPLLNQCEANRIDIYSLPPPGAGGVEASAGRRSSRGLDKKAKATAAGGAKGKGQASSGTHATLPESARRIGGSPLSLVPLLTSTSFDVAIPLSFHAAGGRELRFRVCCRDAPLLTVEGVLQCRPVVLRVSGVEGLPSMPAGQCSETKGGALVSAASSRLLRARVELGDVCVYTPALSAVVPPTPATAAATAASSSAPPRQTSLQSQSLTSQSLASHCLDKLDTPLDHYEHVLFLSAMGNPLEVYRTLYSTPCKVSLWQSFNTGPTEETAASLLKGEAGKAKSETLLGSGAFSVRDFLSDDQLRFSESVQLLPDRSSVSLAGGQTCLTTASSIKVNLDFLQPFPPVQHVDQTGTVLHRRAFLTHAVLRLPYQAPWTAECLGLLLQEITSLPRAVENVRMYALPPPSPPAENQDNSEKAAVVGRTGAGARASKKSAIAKPESANAAKGSSRTAALPPPGLAAPPAYRFDAPLQLVSPAGLSGFEVTDGKERVWCLEGTVPEVHHILSKVTDFLERSGYAHTATSLLFNAELFVPARAYLSFPALVTPPVAAAGAAGATAARASSPSSLTGAVALEVEPSGTGGRLHRIRLRTTLTELRHTQAHYVRHNLSDECLDCLTYLSALLGAASMREVEVRGWLPSASLLIALERSFGQTLEQEDLYGALSSSTPMKEAAGAATTRTTSTTAALPLRRSAAEGEGQRALSAVSITHGVPVGSLVSFDGAIKMDGTRRPIPAAARQRFPITSWMVVSDTGEEVLCAFAQSAPTGLVQYHVEGQVVQAASVTLLYVLKCVCLARSFTQSHNLEYEQLLRERQRAQQAHLVGKTVFWPITSGGHAALAESERHGDAHRREHHLHHANLRGSSAASPAAATTGQSARRTTEASSDDEADGDDWLASDFYDKQSSLATLSQQAPPLSGPVTRRRPNEHSRTPGTKDRLQSQGVPATHKAVKDEELWRLYDERAPAAASGIAGGGHSTLPPLHR